MPSPDSKTRARAEIESQLNTEKKSFGCVAEAEQWEYEDKATHLSILR